MALTKPGPQFISPSEDSNTIRNVEHILRSQFDDTITGDSLVNVLIGGAVGDTLSGGSGGDVLIGEDGDDVLIGGEGDDDLDGGEGAGMFVFLSASAGGDGIHGFRGASGDRIDLSALAIGGGGQAVRDLVDAGLVAVLHGNELRVDLDGGDGIDGNGTIRIATFLDGGGGFDINTDLLV